MRMTPIQIRTQRARDAEPRPRMIAHAVTVRRLGLMAAARGLAGCAVAGGEGAQAVDARREGETPVVAAPAMLYVVREVVAGHEQVPRVFVVVGAARKVVW